MNIESLKSFKVKNNDIETLVGIRAEIKLVATNCAELQLDIPDWVDEKLNEVEAEIKSLSKAEKMAKLKKIESMLRATMGREEKRAALQAERDALLDSMK